MSSILVERNREIITNLLFALEDKLSLKKMQGTVYVTHSREMSHLSKIQISIFLHPFLKTSKWSILMQTPLQLDI